MNSEINRLHTFSRWPSSAPVDPATLARGGFFYTGEGTEVQCFSCNTKISNWNYGDQVMARHRLAEPHCTYVLQPSLSGNVTISNTARSPSLNEEVQDPPSEDPDAEVTAFTDYGLTGEDEIYRNDALRLLSYINWQDNSVSREALVNAGFYHAGGGRLRCAWCGGELAPFENLGSLGTPLEIHRMYFPGCDHASTILTSFQMVTLPPSSAPFYIAQLQPPPVASDNNVPQSSGAAHNSLVLSSGSTWRELGVIGGGAKHPGFSSVASRLASFTDWPADHTQTPLAMAEAGFFHTPSHNQADEVRCFYCDGGLGRWESGDEPWSEHARWFPGCGYVVLVKGQEFADSCDWRVNSRTGSTQSRVPRNPRHLPVTEEQVNICLESYVGLGALQAGLDVARVKRAIARRLRDTGVPFLSPEALIDAVLNEQLNEEAWSFSSNALALDFIPESLREYLPSYLQSAPVSDNAYSDNTRSPSPTTTDRVHPNQRQARSSQSRSPTRGTPTYRTRRNNSPRQRSSSQNRSPTQRATRQNRPSTHNRASSESRQEQLRSPLPNFSSSTQERSKKHPESTGPREPSKDTDDVDIEIPKLSLQEENRQLKESRICKVCMDNEVSVVFLPCGHLVSCAGCGAALSSCPLCRATVKAMVRAYLA